METFPIIFIVLALIIASGILSLFSYALASCRKSRIEKMENKIFRQLITVIESPQKILIACRLWIIILRVLAVLFAGIIVMRYSGAVFAAAAALTAFCLGIIIAVLGDDLPELISRTKPEKIAAILLPLVKILSLPLLPLTLPAIKLASFFQKIFRLKNSDNNMTEDELRDALIEGEKSGIVESKERTMVEGVFYLGDRPVGAFMTHRSEIQWLDCNAPYEEICSKAIEYRNQRCFPVTSGGPDEIIGAVFFEDILLDQWQADVSKTKGLAAIMKKAQFVPETMPALKAFESFKQGQANFLFVMDEYGGLAGILSIESLVEEIVGELSAPAVKEEPLLRMEDGSMLADGTLNIDDAAKALSLAGLGEESDFHTLAGFILFLAGELPSVGDSFVYRDYKFIVKEMDGNRIDKILIIRCEAI